MSAMNIFLKRYSYGVIIQYISNVDLAAGRLFM